MTRRIDRIRLITFILLICGIVTLSASIMLQPVGARPLTALPHASSAICQQPATTNVSILAIYVLAFDNDPSPTNKFNLSPKYADTLTGIVNATAVNSDVQAVILSDRDTDDDTRMLTVANGLVNVVNCLPDETGILVDGILEMDTTDGATLGGYIKWAMATFPASQRVFSYIGHGTFFAPETGTPIATLVNGGNQTRSGTALSPLPSQLTVNPFFTDAHVPGGPPDFIKPADLATALNFATNGGATKLDVIDLVHCFAASAEELYEVHDFAQYTTAAPNYAFYDPTMPGAALANLSTVGGAGNMAQTILDAYDSIIPSTNHPNALVGTDNGGMLLMKESLDRVSEALMDEFATSPAAAIAAIDAAYLASVKFDTTYCEEFEDLALEPPDSLSDMRDFIEKLSQQSLNNDTIDRLQDLLVAIESTIPFAPHLQSGSPWFYEGGGVPPVWNFGDEPVYSLYTPFDVWTSSAGDEYHVWQSLWYTYTTSYEIGETTTISNPQPLRMIVPDEGGSSWADVVARYWAEESEQPGVDVNSAFCSPPLVSLRPGTVRMEMAVSDDVDPVETSENIVYTVRVANSGPATATQLAIIHTFAPETVFADAPATCVPEGNGLVCPVEDLPPGEAAEYALAVRAVAPGLAQFLSEISVFQLGLPVSETVETTITGTPLAVAMVGGGVSAEILPLILLTTLLSIFSLLLLKTYRKNRE